mgnify:CR=1 FL=1
MNEEILTIAESVSNEKDLPKETIFEAIELALASAAKKKFTEEVSIKVDIDPDTGEYSSYRTWEVVDFDNYEEPNFHILVDSDNAEEKGLKVGDIYREPIENPEFGRIAAQTAKQVISFNVREAERERQFNDFIEKKDTILSGIVLSLIHI